MMASAAALLSVSGSIPKQMGEPVQELLEEHVIRIDAQGRRTIQYRYIFRIDEASAVDSWSSVSAEWSPWYEARPAVQARVITPDGTVHFLDQKTLGEYGADDPDSNVFGDRKHLRGPLPMLRPGALAEVMTTYRESEPFSQAGVRGRIPLLQNVPVYRTVVQIETPADRPLKTSLTGIPSARPVREERRGLSTLTLTLGPLAARAPQEANLPSDSAQAPSLHYSTATGWGAVALEYAGILDRQLAGEDLAAWVRETVDPAASRAEKISRIVERLHREVRYTGVEFKDAAIVPARPSESLKRGYGDCKDKATLFVCMLREAGIAAEVALLRSGTAPDVDPGTPGLSAFNHAIVFLPGDEPAWIDATADLSSPGKPLHGVEGRWALVAAKSTTGLAKVPELSPGANRYREIRKVRFKEGASGDILETTMAEGWWEDRYRNDFSQMDPKKLRENLEGYATRTFSAKALGAFKHSEPRKLGAPFELELEILGTPQVKMDDTQAVVSMNPWPLVTKLQKVLQEGLGEEKGTARQRQAELQMPEPYLHQLIYQVDVPAGFSVSEPLKGREVHFGPALLTISFRQEGNRRLFAECSMNTGKRRWTAPEVNQALESIRAFGDEKIPQIVMEQVGEQLLAAGKIREAIAEFQRLTLELPGQASPHNRIARAFLAAGLGEAARIEARRAIALDAKSATAQETLGWVLQHDLLGRRFKPGWDFRGALEAYRKAKALDPTRYSIRGDLAILLEYDAEGRRYSPGADLDSSILEYRALSTDLKNHTLDANLVLTLAKRARYQESVDLAKTVPQGVVRDSWLVVGLVRLQGVEGAIEESRRLITDVSSRRTAWTNAADHLLNLRLYPEAARLLMEASNGSDQMSQLRGRSELISRVRRVEPSDKDWRDPAGLVRQFLITVLRQTGEPEQIRSFFSPAVTHFLDQEALTQMLRSAKSVLRGVQLAPEALADVTASLVQIASEGDDSRGYRVQVRGFGEQAHVFFVTPSKGGYRLVGAGDELPFLGVEAAWQLDQGNLALAGAWLDLAREAMPSPPSDDPLAGPGFARF
jgi:transglutaminase-like putative cysteine protease/tetratricopeptide (TPR) repeat protein